MLVLSRKLNEDIVINDHTIVTVRHIGNGRVRLGVTAPADVLVRRGELPKAIVDIQLQTFREQDHA